jgi:hypothetical protein
MLFEMVVRTAILLTTAAFSCEQHDKSDTKQAPAPRETASPGKMFHCQLDPKKAPGHHEDNEPRMCDRAELDEAMFGPSFAVPSAYCYSASKLKFGSAPQWSKTETTEHCFATIAECETDRKNLGSGALGPPPVKLDCSKTAP